MQNKDQKSPTAVLNRFSAPEMYTHVLNGRAWVRHLNGWRAISSVTTVSVANIPKLKYPLYYRIPKGEAACINENTNVMVAEEEKYWSMADIAIYSGDDLNTRVKKEKPCQEEPD